MATSDVRMSAIQIVNEVQRKVGLNPTTAFTTNKHARLLLDLLNDVIDECSDYGDWPQMIREVSVTASSSVGEYKLAVSADVQRVHEIVWADDISPLEVRSVEDIRRLQRTNAHGKPRQFALVGVSGSSPKFRVYPTPNTSAITVETSASATFDVLYYKKPRLLVEADTTAAVIPAFPSRVLVQGLYAKALLEESGGNRTSEFVVAFAEYERMRSEAQNRYTSDTGGDAIYFTPTGGRYT